MAGMVKVSVSPEVRWPLHAVNLVAAEESFLAHDVRELVMNIEDWHNSDDDDGTDIWRIKDAGGRRVSGVIELLDVKSLHLVDETNHRYDDACEVLELSGESCRRSLEEKNAGRCAWMRGMADDLDVQELQKRTISDIRLSLTDSGISSLVKYNPSQHLRLRCLEKIMLLRQSKKLESLFSYYTYEMTLHLRASDNVIDMDFQGLNGYLCRSQYIIPDFAIDHVIEVSKLSAGLNFGLNDVVIVPGDLTWAYIFSRSMDYRRTLLDFSENQLYLV